MLYFFFSKTVLLLDYVICFVSPGKSVALVGLCNKILVNLVLLAVVADWTLICLVT